VWGTVQKVQDMLLAPVQGWCRGARARAVQEVQAAFTGAPASIVSGEGGCRHTSDRGPYETVLNAKRCANAWIQHPIYTSLAVSSHNDGGVKHTIMTTTSGTGTSELCS
jgi:hypothetical protein